ncbi:MAG: hypothetical protein IJU37_07150 [Desulfovibrio sp.]|nr:hypothetical protein [Desulfovibrio sp.]
MAILSFCLGAASVVAASYAHKFLQERRDAKKARLAAALEAVRDGQPMTDKETLRELYGRGWIADVPTGQAITAAGAEFLAARAAARAVGQREDA